MPILSRRSQSQYFRRQAVSGQSVTGDRKKRHNNAVHPIKSAIDNHDLSRISSVCRQGTAHPTMEHSRVQQQPSQFNDVHPMTSLPEVNYTANCNSTRSGSGSWCPIPPPSLPLAYYSRPAVIGRQRRMPADNEAREREALKRQQRLQVVKTSTTVVSISL